MLLAALAFLWFAPVRADTGSCAEQFWRAAAPRIVNPKLAANTRELCYSGYAVLHSGVTRTPLWSAEHLTRERVEEARSMTRVNSFHPDSNLPLNERSELSDYARSGFDRGHMAPSGDMPDPRSQEESFSLANMIPQDPDNNRHLWEGIESSVRELAERDGEVYVVTGPIFEGEKLESLNGRVLVPTRIYKAVYDPSRNQAGAYVTPNAEGSAWEAVSILELLKIAGIDPFPALREATKASSMDLPKPIQRPRRDHRLPEPAETSSTRPGDFVSEILKEIDPVDRP